MNWKIRSAGTCVAHNGGMRNLSRALVVAVAFLVLAALLSFASKQFSMPVARDAQTYPAHDIHNDEKVTIAADPYDTTDKGAIFTQKYAESGYLPIFLVITNNSDEPVSMPDIRVEFVTQHTKIASATMDDLYRRFSTVKRRGDEPRTNPLPYPFPKKGPQAGVNQHASDEFHAAMFQAKAVEPHSSQAGFFFFDVDDISQPLAGAHLYVNGVRDNNGQELMYFDIPMEKYVSAAK